MTNAFWEVRILMSEDLAGAGTKLDGRRSLERTSIVCYLMIEDLGGEVTRLINFMEFDKDKTSIVCNLVIEDLWGVRIWRNEDLGGVRILEEWRSWRSEDLGGLKILEEWGRDWQKWGVWQWKTSIVCALEEWGSWRSEYLWGVKILEEQVRDWRTRGVYKRQTCIICCLMIEDLGGD